MSTTALQQTSAKSGQLIKINFNNEQHTVSGRELHAFLDVKERYNQWFPRMAEYGFEEGTDYFSFTEFSVKPQGGRPGADHALTLDMAKEISMIQRTPRGKQARQYFIAIEKDWRRRQTVPYYRYLVESQAIPRWRLLEARIFHDFKTFEAFSKAVPGISIEKLLCGETPDILMTDVYRISAALKLTEIECEAFFHPGIFFGELRRAESAEIEQRAREALPVKYMAALNEIYSGCEHQASA